MSRIDRLLAEARATLPGRIEPADLAACFDRGALVVDIRSLEHRERDGPLPGAVVVDRNVLEWRLDPTSPDRLPGADDPDREIVLVCSQGFQSSLAAANLQRLGLHKATDLAGGFEAWASQASQVRASGRGGT